MKMKNRFRDFKETRMVMRKVQSYRKDTILRKPKKTPEKTVLTFSRKIVILFICQNL